MVAARFLQLTSTKAASYFAGMMALFFSKQTIASSIRWHRPALIRNFLRVSGIIVDL